MDRLKQIDEQMKELEAERERLLNPRCYVCDKKAPLFEPLLEGEVATKGALGRCKKCLQEWRDLQNKGAGRRFGSNYGTI